MRPVFPFLCSVNRIVLIFLLLGFSVNAQVLNNRGGEAFTDRPFFNEDFIRANHLKRLEGYFVYKKQGELMQDTKFRYVYNFDESGRLTSTYETKPDGKGLDTLWNYYEYTPEGFLAVHRKTDQEGYTSVHNTYDDQGRVVQVTYTRDYTDSSGLGIARSLAFNTERMEYANYGRQTRCTRYNSDNLAYLDEYHNYNDLGYLVERTERIKMTSTVYTYAYEYNEKGKLAAIRKSSNQQEGFLEEFLFKYDDLGNLIEKHIYRNGVFTTDIQIIYNSKSRLLATVITRQVSTGFMTILRFKDYEFYD